MEHAERRRRRAVGPMSGLAAAATVLGLVAGCTSGGPDGAAPSSVPTPVPSGALPTSSRSRPGTAPPQRRAGPPSVLVSGLEVPWGVAFLPGGDALVSERISHHIKRVTPAGAVTEVGRVDGVADNAGEGGLLGIAVSPSFTHDRLVYAYYTGADDNRIVRFRYDGGHFAAPQDVLTGIPKAANHDGGRIAFGPDGLLYATTGDANDRARAPDPGYLGGKVLRMTADGHPAPGNPQPDSVVYTGGHRNPQGLAWGPDGSLYEAEFGQNSLDEVNRLEPGRNYGWPTVEGTIGPHDQRFTAPLLTFATDDASPSGLAYAGGSLWLGTLQGKRLYRVPVVAGGRLGRPAALLDGDYGRLRTVATAPDGSLWVTTSNRDGRGDATGSDDRIIRIPLS